MRIRLDRNPDGRVTGYTLWLSKADTADWANRPGACWPCSTLSGRAVRVAVDYNGLCDFSPDRPEADSNELEAIVGDHLPAAARHLWPTWETPDTSRADQIKYDHACGYGD